MERRDKKKLMFVCYATNHVNWPSLVLNPEYTSKVHRWDWDPSFLWSSIHKSETGLTILLCFCFSGRVPCLFPFPWQGSHPWRPKQSFVQNYKEPVRNLTAQVSPSLIALFFLILPYGQEVNTGDNSTNSTNDGSAKHKFKEGNCSMKLWLSHKPSSESKTSLQDWK